jgi:hypothetical protein
MNTTVATGKLAKLRATERSRVWRNTILPIFALVVMAGTVYYPVRYLPFFGLDDPNYITENPHVLGPLNLGAIRWAFTHEYCLNYAPVDFLTHSINVRLFGINP